MDSPDILTLSGNSCSNSEHSNEFGKMRKQMETSDFLVLREQVISNFQKPNLPNVNIPEKIVICLDVCCDDNNSLYRLADGTTFTPINMMKRILDFFLYSKHAINKGAEFAILLLKNEEPVWLHNFTNNIKEIINVVDYINSEECTTELFDFKKVFKLLNQKVIVPEYKAGECILPPPYVVRMIVLYGRSNCVPVIPQDDPIFINLQKQFYFYIDILLAHEDDCAMFKCEEIYDALQDLDNGYSYVHEVSRNATKIHDCIAKLLAHPLQRPLQKNSNHMFGTQY